MKLTISSALYLGALLLSAATVGYLQLESPRPPTAATLNFAFNEGKPVLSPSVGRLVSFGYPRALSSILWLRFLQYTPTEKVPAGQRSWIYYDLLTISRLDPDFKPTYKMGALFLSVITEDHAGAEQVLLRGAELHPDDFSILGNLAYHYQFEMGEPEKAGPYFLKAAKIPGAPYIYSIMASNYLKEAGSAGAAEKFLAGMLSTTTDEKLKEKLLLKMQKLRGEKSNESAGN
ncbi:MAG: hypothetical protein EOP11_03265 [Proteobacteria bacterium]|nr:MAG: hypothetical protein EOP11_03265 [Pseudomonadota bacterium]